MDKMRTLEPGNFNQLCQIFTTNFHISSLEDRNMSYLALSQHCKSDIERSTNFGNISADFKIFKLIRVCVYIQSA